MTSSCLPSLSFSDSQEYSRVELGPGGEHNMEVVEPQDPPDGDISIVRDEPIVAVTVVGSACVTTGYVILHTEPHVWEYPRTG